MPHQPDAASSTMVELIGRAIAGAEGTVFQANADRYRRLAPAALGLLAKRTELIVDAAYEAVSFDADWAINGRRDSKGRSASRRAD